MNRKFHTAFRISGVLFLAFFFLINLIAFNHAEKFTRFSPNSDEPRTKLDQLSGLKRASVVLFGIKNPKPKNDSFPDVAYQTIKIGTERPLEGWLLSRDSALGTVVLFHGYSGNKSQLVPHAKRIYEMGWNALLIDFYGTGGSEGNESTIGYKEAQDVFTAFEYVREGGAGRIVLFGTSMGAAAVMKAASEEKVNPDGLILECPFGNMRNAVKVRVENMGAPTFPFTDLFMLWGGALNGFWTYSLNPEDYARKISVPTLLMYGEQDNKVPRHEIDLIFERLSGSKKLVTFPESGHESYLPRYEEEWENEVKEFLSQKAE